jgi:hypothetical protein
VLISGFSVACNPASELHTIQSLHFLPWFRFVSLHPPAPKETNGAHTVSLYRLRASDEHVSAILKENCIYCSTPGIELDMSSLYIFILVGRLSCPTLQRKLWTFCGHSSFQTWFHTFRSSPMHYLYHPGLCQLVFRCQGKNLICRENSTAFIVPSDMFVDVCMDGNSEDCLDISLTESL